MVKSRDVLIALVSAGSAALLSFAIPVAGQAPGG
jgi:hypothetical protein